MGVNLGEPDGTVGDAQSAWFEARARGGTGLIIVGSVAVAYPTASFDRRQIAASNDAKGTFGPPSFKAASFLLERGRTQQRLKMQYR